jgi:DNA invertase Pin-like site-specific DNA recombinase
MLAAFAEFEREIIVARTKEGLRKAKALGHVGGHRYRGRDGQLQRFKLSTTEQERLVRDLTTGYETIGRAARAYGVHRTTLWRALKRQEGKFQPAWK